jgi:O-antigen ligase
MNIAFRTDEIAKSAAVLLVFSAPLSRALFNTTLFLLLVSCLLSSAMRREFCLALQHTIGKLSAALFLLVLLGSLYSPAPTENVLRQVKTYGLFILIPVFIAVLKEKAWQNRALWSFIASLTLILVLTYIDVWVEIPGSSTKGLGLSVDHSIFSDYVVQSIVSVFFIAVCSYQARDSNTPTGKLRWFSLALMSALSIVFLLSSRTGFILLACVVVLIICQNFKGKSLVLIAGILVLLLAAALAISPLALSRLSLAIADFQNITDANNQLSFGTRFATAKAAWDMFLEQPLFGYGTGAYQYLAPNYFKGCTWECVHPHNQYLFFMAEHGLFGVFVYLCFLYALFLLALKADTRLRQLVYCFLLILVIDSFLNAPFWFNREAYFFYTMTGLLSAMMISPHTSRSNA